MEASGQTWSSGDDADGFAMRSVYGHKGSDQHPGPEDTAHVSAQVDTP